MEANNKIAKNTTSYIIRGRRKKKNSKKILIMWLLSGIVIGIMVGVLISKAILIDNDDSSDNLTNEEAGIVSSVEEMLKEEAFVINTPIVNLYYPKQWKEQLIVKQVASENHLVQFWTKIDSKEEVQIFDIVFGGEEGYLLGYIREENGKKISVNIISYEFELGDDWIDEEKDTIYAMAENVNYVIGMIQKEEGFVPAS